MYDEDRNLQALDQIIKEEEEEGEGSKTLVAVGQNELFYKMVINFNPRHGAKKSGHLDNPLQSYGQIYFNTFNIFYEKLV